MSWRIYSCHIYSTEWWEDKSVIILDCSISCSLTCWITLDGNEKRDIVSYSSNNQVKDKSRNNAFIHSPILLCWSFRITSSVVRCPNMSTRETRFTNSTHRPVLPRRSFRTSFQHRATSNLRKYREQETTLGICSRGRKGIDRTACRYKWRHTLGVLRATGFTNLLVTGIGRVAFPYATKQTRLTTSDVNCISCLVRS